MQLTLDLLPRTGAQDVVLLVDVLRATTCAPIVLDVRTRSTPDPRLHVTASLQAARTYAAANDLLLAGERDGLPPQGFHLSASPAQLRAATLERDTVFTSENGPRALDVLTETGAPRTLLLGSFQNAPAAARAALDLATSEIRVVCAGVRGEEATEDIVCAALITDLIEREARVRAVPLNVGGSAHLARTLLRAYPDPQEALAQSRSGQTLMRLGLHEDLAVASLIGQTPTVPVLAHITRQHEHAVHTFTALARPTETPTV
ncbi:2-phosphosulfolactate phosphatase [Deinococcus maricopensis]|uniref:Probable 2-phosphosulfolactate phosphatase n=1 Tax=Deinococcus maricopensis (strain DSM 21211 / LMG 22137 / NRRL B-23946 / LB-34) TaxID=709986 RepID=E8U996_DEIML|nr:2-phosphosulfolactate phosphatase [Deinococcus maricopensis]ADV67635.1 2-phosphosulfolactate phosphatase [Deinococcus maricopensis DSM 21211]